MGGVFDSFGRLGYRFWTDKRNFGSPRYVFEVQFGRPVAISGRSIRLTEALLTFDLFTARSSLLPYAFVWEKIFKNLILQNRGWLVAESLHISSGTGGLPKLLK